MKRVIFILILFIAANSYAFAEKVSFTTSAPEAVVVGEQFRLSYTVNSFKVSDFKVPSIKGFDVLMGPSRSEQSNTQIINGNVSSTSSITYTYILVGNSPGTFTLPSAMIVVNGQKIVSNSLTIKVLPPDKQADVRDEGRSRKGAKSGNISSQDLFITSSVSKASLYEQEAFILTYKIYTKEPSLRINGEKLPDFKGFHSQEIERNANVHLTQEHYKGRNYLTAVYRQFVLFPQQAGKLYIDPMQLEMTVGKTIETADPFDAFFNGGSNVIEIKKTISTPKTLINVNKLPAGKPSDYSGGVGEFSFSSSIDKQKVKVNEALTLKVIISGVGNLKLISNPDIKFPADFEVYDPKVDLKTQLTAKGVSGNKVIEYLIIPRNPGKFKIPNATFSYFDINSKTYKTVKTEEYDIEVEKGSGNSNQVVANFTNKENLKVLGEDIRFIKQNQVSLHSKDDLFFGSMLFYLFYIVPALVFMLALILYHKQAKENLNVAKMRTKKANKIAIKRMKVTKALLASNQKEAFYNEVLKALWGYTSDKLNIPISRLSKDNIEEQLKQSNVEVALIEEFIHVLNECEFARFAPGDAHQAMDKIYTSSIELISKMENSIKR